MRNGAKPWIEQKLKNAMACVVGSGGLSNCMISLLNLIHEEKKLEFQFSDADFYLWLICLHLLVELFLKIRVCKFCANIGNAGKYL